MTVWVGTLTIEALDAYLDEPGGAADDAPISAFCADLGRWYDHDFVWAEAVDLPTDVGTLCALHGVEPEAFVDEIRRAAGTGQASAVLILWNAKVVASVERSFAKGKLRCLGSWPREAPLTDF